LASSCAPSCCAPTRRAYGFPAPEVGPSCAPSCCAPKQRAHGFPAAEVGGLALSCPLLCHQAASPWVPSFRGRWIGPVLCPLLCPELMCPQAASPSWVRSSQGWWIGTQLCPQLCSRAVPPSCASSCDPSFLARRTTENPVTISC